MIRKEFAYLAAFAVMLSVIFTGCHGFFVDPTLQSIVVGPAATINEGSTLQMTARGSYSDGSSKVLKTTDVEWNSSSDNIASVSSSGMVTGKALGAATITGTYQALNATAQIKVDLGDVTTFEIAPNTATMAIGDTQKFTASATVAGVPHDITSNATWSSSDTANVTITQGSSPVVVTIGSGAKSGEKITLTATYGSPSITATATINVQ